MITYTNNKKNNQNWNQSASKNTNQFTKTQINFKTPINSQNQNQFF